MEKVVICRRCGAETRSPRAVFCPRCGYEFGRVEIGRETVDLEEGYCTSCQRYIGKDPEATFCPYCRAVIRVTESESLPVRRAQNALGG